MDEKTNWTQNQVTYQLFGYENSGGKNTELWENPRAFSRYTGQQGKMLEMDFDSWLERKRSFTRDEVLKGSWIKISDIPTVREAHLIEDGTLTENDLFLRHDTWQGHWNITYGVLILRIGDYKLFIYAAKEGVMHSGVELVNNKPTAYFKVIHLA